MPDFLVRRDDLRTTRVVDDAAPGALGDGAARLRVERFGFTANNVTYGAFGEQMGYWRFFPAQDGWGRIPVWGFGEVVESQAEGVKAGQRFYGYFPMSSAVTMRPRAGGGGFEDAAEHRAALPATYNRYFEATTEAGFAPEDDAATAVMRPLFMTGWLIAQQLGRGGAVALASASSKTAYCTAHALNQLDDAPSVIGLTSARNADFTRSLGFYDTVLTYDQVGELPRGEGLRYVDMAGDADLRRAVHEHLATDLHASIVVGATHWDHASLDGGDALPGPRPEFFFAPTVAERLASELGPAELQRRIGADWARFLEPLAAVLDIEQDEGPEAVERVYRAFLDGTADPRKGHVLNL
jgi:hypothetical protein